MTSANVIEYTISKDGTPVGYHRQNIMCLTCNDGLELFKPANEYTIRAGGYDEEEEYWEDDNKENLEVWLKKHPAQYSHKTFQPNDKVKINLRETKQKGEGTILETLRDRLDLFSHYTVELNGERIENVKQIQVLPI